MDNSSRKPMLLCFAGPNGSGKSTITKYFDIVGEYTNADDVVSSTGMGGENPKKEALHSAYLYFLSHFAQTDRKDMTPILVVGFARMNAKTTTTITNNHILTPPFCTRVNS